MQKANVFDTIENENIQQRNIESMQKIKFITTSFADLTDKYSYHGLGVKDKLFTPIENMDADSSLRFGKEGGEMTNYRVKTQLGELPLPTMPARYAAGVSDTDIDSELKGFSELPRDSRSSIPIDCTLYNRSFQLFSRENGIPEPNPVTSVEPFNLFGPRGGYATRLDD